MNTSHEHSTGPADCERFQVWLASLEDLSDEERSRLHAHLQGCERCRAVASWIPEVEDAAASASVAPDPEPAYFADLRQRVMVEVASEASPRRALAVSGWRRWLRAPVLAPTAILIVAAGLITVQVWQDDPVTTPLGRSTDRVRAPLEEKVVDAAEPVAETPASRAELGDDASARGTAPADETPPEERAELDAQPGPAPPTAASPARDEEAGEKKDPALAAREDQPPAEEALEGFAENAEKGRRFEESEDSVAGAFADPRERRHEREATLRALLAAARETEGRPDEEEVLSQLLDGLEAADVSAPTERMKREARSQEMMALRQASPTQSVSNTADADVPSAALPSLAAGVADSAAAHLRGRLPHVEDPELRRRIQTWLWPLDPPAPDRE
jgi:hypothetical protein